ncbi:formylglycine-generating enzyme family protein [Pseudaquabacterium rugosum]|uniref:SUMF1/EgtB/PvdO family nonheme iron enzyme n=1 Tax=Pseudaquabacterium rugosum TaxID=2984194 RepID=A0ABU9BCE4_9BURK
MPPRPVAPPSHPAPLPARPAALTLALLLALAAWPGLPARAQAISAPPLGYPTPAELAEARKEAAQLREALGREQAKAKAAQQAADAANARATQAERAAAAAEVQSGKANPEQLAALRLERDAARAEAASLRTELAQANEAVKRLKAAASDAGASTAELTRLRRQSQEQQDTITTLRTQLAAEKKATASANAAASAAAASAAAAAAATRQPPAPVARTTAPQPAPSTTTTTAPLPPDLSDITVPGCGAACPTFVLIPNPGPVTLGTGSDALRIDFKHRYAMASTETTVGQWKAFINDSGYRPEKASDTYCNWDDKAYSSDDKLPVACVNVTDAEAYAAWFARKYAGQMRAQGQANGAPLRIDSIGLPSELEWEFAARGGRYTEKYLWDDGASDAETCRHGQNYKCHGGAKPVGERLKNGYRLHDMIGNVWEWTASPWRDQRSALPLHGREAPAGVSGPRSVRGASFVNFDVRLALSYRLWYTPGDRYSYIGFRLVARIAP